ncbi:hypothetical protein M569_07703, partial [Genlisea aurea]
VIALIMCTSTAEIKRVKVSSDSRPIITFERFGFTRAGRASITVSDASVESAVGLADLSRLGFFLLSEESLIDLDHLLLKLQSNPSYCVLNSRFITRLFTFEQLSPPPYSSFNSSYSVKSAGEYSLVFANCARESKVSMEVITEVYNLDDSMKENYLSVGLTQLPSLYFFFTVLYFTFLGYWIHFCYQNAKSVHRIHMLIGLLILMKALNMFSASEDMHYVEVTGTPHGWDVLFYAFHFIRIVLLFTVIVLIGTGWSFLRPVLQGREKNVLMIAIPLQVLANVAFVVTGETGPFIKHWLAWNHVLLLVDMICCCAILFPILWSIRSLRETSKSDGKAAINLAKLTLFRQFYSVVIGYLFFTRIVVLGIRNIVGYKYQWAANAAEEVASLAFYLITFYMFRPIEKNGYYFVPVEEEKEADASEFVHTEDQFEL